MQRRFGSPFLLPVLLLCLAFDAGRPASAQLLREDGATYLEDIMERLPRVKITGAAPIYYDIGMRRVLGEMVPNQAVELQAVSDGAFRIRGRARHGQVAGWVRPEALVLPGNSFLEDVRKAAERKRQVDALIAANEAAVGMTQDEVKQSLGRPEKKTSRMDANSRQELWEYIRYERVPQYFTRYDRFGQPYNDTVYVKMPTGRLSVSFKDQIVESVEQTEGEILPGGRARIVTRPLMVY